MARSLLKLCRATQYHYVSLVAMYNKQQWCKAYKGYQPRVQVEFDRAFQLSLIASIAKALMFRPLFLISSPHLEQFRTYLEHLSPMPISRISITARGHLCTCAQKGCAVHGHRGRLAIPPACLVVHGLIYLVAGVD